MLQRSFLNRFVFKVFFELKLCDQWAPMGDYDENEQPLVSVYQTTELPDRFHWKNFQYMPEIVLITRPGATVLTVYYHYIPVVYSIPNTA